MKSPHSKYVEVRKTRLKPHPKASHTIKICGQPMPKTLNGGLDRGTCTRPLNLTGKHIGRCSNNTCRDCGVALKFRWELYHKICKSCNRERKRRISGAKEKLMQTENSKHTFHCGCTGILPAHGVSTKFVAYSSKTWTCRVHKILRESERTAKIRGYKPMSPDTPHSAIRKLMEEPNCVLCAEPLVWNFGCGKTPHLHHNHETGEIFGFTHPRCNPFALEREVMKLRKELAFFIKLGTETFGS